MTRDPTNPFAPLDNPGWIDKPFTDHFNKLTPAEAERLAMLAEECAEVVQIVGKILRHGYGSHHPEGGPDNRTLLHREITDLLSVNTMLVANGDIPVVLDVDIWSTWEKKLRFTHHQEQPE